MSVSLIITRGFGNGTLSGEIGRVITRGFDQNAVPPPPPIGFKSRIRTKMKNGIRNKIRNS